MKSTTSKVFLLVLLGATTTVAQPVRIDCRSHNHDDDQAVAAYVVSRLIRLQTRDISQCVASLDKRNHVHDFIVPGRPPRLPRFSGSVLCKAGLFKPFLRSTAGSTTI
jgi:hypothetical protein